MSSSASTVHATHVTFDLLGKYVDLDWRIPIPGCLTWFPDRPWEVRITFHTPSMDVTWIAGRELLRDGLTGNPPGIGDIRVWKNPQRTQRAWLRIHLISRTDAALFRVPAREVREFLAETVRVIPLGTEFDAIDFDSAVAGGVR